jgi:hypothetical protein
MPKNNHPRDQRFLALHGAMPGVWRLLAVLLCLAGCGPDQVLDQTSEVTEPVDQSLLFELFPTVARGAYLPFELDQLKLLAVGGDQVEPLALIEDPDGLRYVVHRFARIGSHKGVLAQINNGKILLIETLQQDSAPFCSHTFYSWLRREGTKWDDE